MSPFDAGPPRSAKRRRPSWLSAIWLVPLLAAGGVGVVVERKMSQTGPEIEISLRDGQGLEAGRTDLLYKGVTMGTVDEVELSDDGKRIVAKVKLKRSASSLAREGAQFWLVRPRVSAGGVSALGAIVTGPYLEGTPGRGESRDSFEALDQPPALAGERRGLSILLTMPRLRSLEPGTPLYYRGVQVGSVAEVKLSEDAKSVQARAVVDRSYKGLVRTGSKFWSAGGLDVKAGLFKGLEISAKSLTTLVAGGVAFATPDPPGPQASEGQSFPLEEDAKKEWLQWAPAIKMPKRPPQLSSEP